MGENTPFAEQSRTMTMVMTTVKMLNMLLSFPIKMREAKCCFNAELYYIFVLILIFQRCVEKGREKCDHYWPYETQPVYYGDIQVFLKILSFRSML